MNGEQHKICRGCQGVEPRIFDHVLITSWIDETRSSLTRQSEICLNERSRILVLRDVYSTAPTQAAGSGAIS